MLDLRIMADGQPCTPLELPLRIGRAAAVAEISEQIEALIATLDRLDGDPDVELNGDELDGSACAEDEFWPHWRDHHAQPGCPIADPGGDPLDKGEHPSDDGTEVLATAAAYGIDKSIGPRNHEAAIDTQFHTRSARGTV